MFRNVYHHILFWTDFHWWYYESLWKSPAVHILLEQIHPWKHNALFEVRWFIPWQFECHRAIRCIASCSKKAENLVLKLSQIGKCVLPFVCLHFKLVFGDTAVQQMPYDSSLLQWFFWANGFWFFFIPSLFLALQERLHWHMLVCARTLAYEYINQHLVAMSRDCSQEDHNSYEWSWINSKIDCFLTFLIGGFEIIQFHSFFITHQMDQGYSHQIPSSPPQ